MSGEGPLRTAGLDLPAGLVFEYKFTLGSWDREALGPSGMVMGNNRLVIDGPKTVRHAIGDFKKDAIEYVRDVAGSGVVGTLIYRENVTSAYLAETRHVSIWLPPGYEDDPARRYPVIYMSDGQNLFDPRIANTGVDWGVDEARTEHQSGSGKRFLCGSAQGLNRLSLRSDRERVGSNEACGLLSEGLNA